MNIKEELLQRSQRINAALQGLSDVKPEGTAPRLWEAMNYSLGLGGKRIRPILLLEGARLVGVPEEQALPLALAFEMAHTASLIHDDLPSMDNDDLRRGKASNHKVFGEGLALLAGDALLVYGFQLVLEAQSSLSYEARARGLAYFARALGPQGICSGQVFDTDPASFDPSFEGALTLAGQKTGILLTNALLAGAALGEASGSLMNKLKAWGEKVGLAFQVSDDILDVIGNPQLMGKTLGKDQEQGKKTFVAHLGVQKARELLNRLTDEAKGALEGVSGSEFLCALADTLRDRQS